MRNMTTILAAAFSLGFATAALAEDPPAQPAPAATQGQQTAADPDKKICRMMTHEGMLVRSNVCHTQREWDAIRTRQQHEVADFQNRNYQTMSGK